jgi:predicted MPP superfamily phosphohydrolase
MFHTILTLSYLLPGLYLFIRIWQLFIAKEHRLRYVLIFAFLFLIYPLENFLSGTAGQIVETVANYLLPFYLYLFLFVLLTDLLLLINLVFKIMPHDKLRPQPVRYRFLLLIACLSLAIVIAGIINFNTIRTSKYQIEVPRGSRAPGNLRIAFASDFHLEDNTPLWFVEKFVKSILAINPDLMLFGGDIVEGGGEGGKMQKFEDLLNNIKAEYGVYGVLGNHEHYGSQSKVAFFERAGIVLLRDSTVMPGKSFILTGRNDSHTRERMTLDELMQSVPDSLPVILLDHRPNEILRAGRTHADIQFSGHTHHGQLFPINLITNSVYELSWGYRKIGNTHFFVSSGIRLWGPPVRTTGKSEIIVVDVMFR